MYTTSPATVVVGGKERCMSAMISFSESRRVTLPEWTGQMRSGLFAVALGVALTYIAAFIFIPSDTLSTAIWIDELGLRHAITGTTSIFNAINPYPLSLEAFYFSVFVSVANIALAYLTVFGGGWIEGKDNSTFVDVLKMIFHGNVSGINMTKMGYFTALVCITIFETLTGADFRGQDGTLWGWLKAVGFAFIVENAGSDFALTAGVGLFLGGALQVYDAFTAGRGDIRNLRDALAGRTPSRTNDVVRNQQPGRNGNANGGGHNNGDRNRDKHRSSDHGGNRGGDRVPGRDRREIVVPDGLPVHESRFMPVPRYDDEG